MAVHTDPQHDIQKAYDVTANALKVTDVGYDDGTRGSWLSLDQIIDKVFDPTTGTLRVVKA